MKREKKLKKNSFKWCEIIDIVLKIGKTNIKVNVIEVILIILKLLKPNKFGFSKININYIPLHLEQKMI